MTRFDLISGLVGLPFVAFGTTAPAATTATSEKTIMFLPGVYRIAPGGEIRVVGANDVYIKGCVFEACPTGLADPPGNEKFPISAEREQ